MALPLVALATRSLLARSSLARSPPALARALSSSSSSASSSSSPPPLPATGAPASSSSSTQQPVQFAGADITAELLAKSAATDARMRRDYDAMPARFAPHAQPPPGSGPGGGGGGGGGEVGVREAFRKRLLYRSKQRGWLEVDLLLGTWAELHLAALPEELLPSYERILNRETLDIFNMITGKEAPPAELEGPVMDSIKRFVAKGGQRFVGPEGYAAIKGGMSN